MQFLCHGESGGFRISLRSRRVRTEDSVTTYCPGGFGFAPAARAQLETSAVPVGQLIIPERGKPYLQLPKASSLC